ncbi:DNA repair protein RadC [Sandaracinus amylolyticus]|uniref:DNA repair protein RadC n=2 Tax=Sandaracinus amylolyticus TaxID=927083 RepID=A0A0F6W6B2_9BACT|nr:DNA repair protein RadC [Sandaracinus amylolyticus]
MAAARLPDAPGGRHLSARHAATRRRENARDRAARHRHARCAAPARGGVVMHVVESFAGDGPRERLRREGREALSEEELVALVLGTGSAREPVTVLAARVVREIGGAAGLARSGVGGLSSIDGLGESKAMRLVAAIELGRRVQQRPWSPGPKIETSRDVDDLLRPRLADQEIEQFVALALDAKNRVSAELKIAVGGLSACPVAPADVFRAILREAAASVVFAHNHPSGDSTPSADDIALTDRLVRAGTLLGVRVLDHVVVGREGYFSFVDAGLLPRSAG